MAAELPSPPLNGKQNQPQTFVDMTNISSSNSERESDIEQASLFDEGRATHGSEDMTNGRASKRTDALFVRRPSLQLKQ